MSVLVLGDGMLGTELVTQTNWDFVSRKKSNLSIFDTDTYFPILEKYDTIVNCIAHTKTYSDEKNLHWDVNYKFVDILADFCSKTNKKLVHISTDHIYAGSVSTASENDVPVHMRTWYGYTKLLGDAIVQLRVKNHLIIRTSFKPYPFPYSSAWSDQFTNGDYINVISGIIIRLIQQDVTGVINVGTEEKTWFNHTKIEFNTTPSNRLKDAPDNITMNISKLKSLL